MTKRITNTAPIELPDAPVTPTPLAHTGQPLAATAPRVSVDGTKATIRIYGTIVANSWWSDTVSSKDVAKALDELDSTVTEIQVRLNSPGGSAFDGVAILNTLRAHPAKITAVVDGYAASAASIIAVGCDETYMSPGSSLMIHNPVCGAWGEVAELEKVIRMLVALQTSMANLYAEAAGSGTAADWAKLMDAETWYTAEEAVAAGLADEVAVVPDAGKTITAGGTEPAEDDLDDEDDILLKLAAQFEQQVAAFGYRYAGRAQAPAPKPPTASAGGSITTHEGSSAVAFTDEQINQMRTRLGIAGDADEATILAALDEALDERAEPESTNVPEGHVIIPAAQLQTLQAGATAGAEAARKLHDRDREAFLDANRAKFPTELRESWAKQYDLNPEATMTALSAMPDLIPVNELGHANDVDASAEEEDVKKTDVYAAWLGTTGKES